MSYSKKFNQFLVQEVDRLRQEKMYKTEQVLTSAQGARVKLGQREVLMFAANNYLGLANNERIKLAAKKSLADFGFGLASVRFIAGTTSLHRELETKVAEFIGTDDAMLFSSCFAANEAFFAAIVQQCGSVPEPVYIYSDELNHASIIDGLRLTAKDLVVKRLYKHNNIEELRRLLVEDSSKPQSMRCIVTDGVFSMEGELANLPELVDLAAEFDSLLFVDDSHAVGVCGASGRGSGEATGVMGKIDVISGTFSKALGGASGGYLSGSKALIEFLRQKARPYIFSNSLPPMAVAGSLEALAMVRENNSLVSTLQERTDYFRKKVSELGFTIIPGNHPIIPILIGPAGLTQDFSRELLEAGLYVVGLWYPVVAENQARLRIQISAAHSVSDLDEALAILEKVGKKLKIIS